MWRQRVQALDAVTAGAFAAVAALASGASPSDRSLAVIVVAAMCIWPLAVMLAGGYRPQRPHAVWHETRSIMSAAAYLVVVVTVVDLFGQTPRPLRPGAVAVSILALPLVSLTLRHVQRLRVRRGHAAQSARATLVAGAPEAVDRIVTELRRGPRRELVPTAECALSAADLAPANVQHTVDLIAAWHPDVVLLASTADLRSAEIRRFSWRLRERGISLALWTGLLDVAPWRLSLHTVSGLPLVQVDQQRPHGGKLRVKAVFDRVVAALILVFVSPVLLACALAVRRDSPGPVIFRQRRIGVDGRAFEMLKVRSMVQNADELLDEVRAERDDGNGKLFKRVDDPRVTRVGAVLRKYSLDELPQLVNVLRGEMSLVGPRPPLPEEVAAYDLDEMHRLKVRPGLTGLWQVNGRSDLSYEESIRLDLQYVDNWTPWLDLRILWRTARAVRHGDGAY